MATSSRINQKVKLEAIEMLNTLDEKQLNVTVRSLMSEEERQKPCYKDIRDLTVKQFLIKLCKTLVINKAFVKKFEEIKYWIGSTPISALSATPQTVYVGPVSLPTSPEAPAFLQIAEVITEVAKAMTSLADTESERENGRRVLAWFLDGKDLESYHRDEIEKMRHSLIHRFPKRLMNGIFSNQVHRRFTISPRFYSLLEELPKTIIGLTEDEAMALHGQIKPFQLNYILCLFGLKTTKENSQIHINRKSRNMLVRTSTERTI